jgi:predicted nuclease with TOPRIM domain
MAAGEIVAVITAVSALIVGIISARTTASKTELESLRTTVATLQSTVVTLQSENKRLLDENKALHETVSRLECENDDLRVRLDELERKRK